MMRLSTFLAATMPAFVATSLAAQTPARIANLRRCSLLNGATIEDCQIGYRTFGHKNTQGSNVILVPTWLNGKSDGWAGLLGPGRIIDTTRYQVIVIDALGNGVSSSPSLTSRAFPQITIEDMVQTQYRLATEVLGLSHVRAVVGVSMGGIQAFEWAAAHPEFVDRFVSIVGSPQVARHDRAWLGTTVRIIEAGTTYKMPADTVWRMIAGLVVLVTDIQEVVNHRAAGEADSLLAASARSMSASTKLADFAAQSRAILAYDFGRRPGSDSASAASRLKGRFLVINSPDDRGISAGPAFSLARRIGLDTLAIRSACGHGVFGCEAERIGGALHSFLAR
jgi:homoserine O-acetyltransferase